MSDVAVRPGRGDNVRGADWSIDDDVDRVAGIAIDVAMRIREVDPHREFRELASLCRFHPAKAAQLIMCFAAWFDPEATTETLVSRAEAISACRVAS